MRQEIEKLTSWIKNFVDVEVGANGVVIGLSGGIDSTVVASLAVKALGKDRVYGVIMPCLSNPKDEEDGKAIAGILGINYCVIGLEAMRNTILSQISVSRLTDANIRARFRMVILYALAGERNNIVIGTGNKSELLTGYFTKYGDGGVDCEPIGDFYKTEVWELAKALGNIPQYLIDRIPSAGLWEGQTDEGDLGMSYVQFDNILQNITEGKPLRDDITQDQYLRVKVLWGTSEHKRKTPPVYERSRI